MDAINCGHDSTDEGNTTHVITIRGQRYELCNECAESFDHDNPPRPKPPGRRRAKG
jgi:hypothetical protein